MPKIVKLTYYQKLSKLKKLEKEFIPIHRTVKDTSYPSIRSDLLDRMLALALTL